MAFVWPKQPASLDDIKEKVCPGSQVAQTIPSADSVGSPHPCPHTHIKTHTPKCYYLSYSKPLNLCLLFPTRNSVSEQIHNPASTTLNQKAGLLSVPGNSVLLQEIKREPCSVGCALGDPCSRVNLVALLGSRK